MNHPQYPRYRKALLAALQSDENSLKRILPFGFWKKESTKVLNFIAESNQIFQHFLAWPKNRPDFKPNLEGRDRASLLAMVLHAMGNTELIEPLSINLRPQSFELSPTTLKTLENLILAKPAEATNFDRCRNLLGLR